jgi:hypothetical protein
MKKKRKRNPGFMSSRAFNKMLSAPARLLVGMRVRVYVDPVTKIKIEGPATVKEIGPRVVDGYYCVVEFDDDPGQWWRTISVDDRI